MTNNKQFSKWLYKFALWSSGYEDSICSTFSQTLGTTRHFLFSSSYWYVVVSHFAFVCLFLLFLFIYFWLVGISVPWPGIQSGLQQWNPGFYPIDHQGIPSHFGFICIFLITNIVQHFFKFINYFGFSPFWSAYSNPLPVSTLRCPFLLDLLVSSYGFAFEPFFMCMCYVYYLPVCGSPLCSLKSNFG